MESGMVSVDRWTAGSQVYFLTHLHADHLCGLTSKWSRGPLYCSRITAKLFPIKFPDFDLSLLRIVEIGHWHSVSLLSPSCGSYTDVDFMAIDAHHCPGAVMYLFRGEFGCTLYTGDFRWESTSERAQTGRTMLLKAMKDVKLDMLYLDNTYCNPTYCFPSREAAAKQVLNIISSHPNHDVIIAVDTLGKENLLLYISRVLKTKIWVWPERLQIMHLLGFHDIFTTKTSVTRIRAVPRYSFNIETLEGLNTIRPTIGIMPSGLPWAPKAFRGKEKLSSESPPVLLHNRWPTDVTTSSTSSKPNGGSLSAGRDDHYIYTVPYSDHSCFPELQKFIEFVMPINIKGIVSSSASNVDPLYHFGSLCRIQQASVLLCQRLRNKRYDKVGVINMRSSFGCTGTMQLGRKRRKRQISSAGIHVSRVRLLRRERQGVKIVDTDPD
ncbi:DNA repair metallo-beta-lactamase family protein isoform 2 [Capsicum annuum]|uniref:5' exonuclease Apollo n=1 Tax=Capsicum annuum TaxID=4072 RepID=UPI001FB0E9DC|nr:5' exonuclease Apollo [Capsicum annuum]KAF3669867.1 DNA repair metallo-beta-lactamase family protein isoform 2 [Capsicum annuum]